MARFAIVCLVPLIVASAAHADVGGDSLAAGIAASKEGRIDSALSLLSRELENPYLEAFRLLYHAKSLSAASRFPEATADLDRLLALARRGALPERHPLVSMAREDYVEDGLKGDSSFAEHEVPFDHAYLSSHSLLMLSSACFKRGLNRAAMDFLFEGSRGRLSPSDTALFRDLVSRCTPLAGGATREARMAIAKGAASLRLRREAETLVDSLIAANPSDYEAVLCKGAILAQTGEERKALHLLWRLFSSRVPTGTKRDALDQIADIEYRLKEYDKAFAHYRMFGLYYPKDSRAAPALDTAARIAVSRSDWRGALDAWATLRRGHGVAALSGEAALSEAVLRYSRGGKAQSRSILEQLLPRVKGSMRAPVLYWLARTSRSKAAGAVWSDSLAHAYPRSFYAAVVRGGETVVSGATRAGNGAVSLEAVETRERKLLDSIAPPTASGDSLARDPAYEAYVYFIDRGLSDEARQAALVCIDLPQTTESFLRTMYRSAVSNGLFDVSMAVLNRLSLRERTAPLPWELWYPAAYATAIDREAVSSGVPASLILAVIREESNFDPRAVSTDGARGLMQLMPATASWLFARSDSARVTPEDLFDHDVSIRTGARYMAYLMRRFKGSLIASLAAYNAGEGKIASWKGHFEPGVHPMVALEMIGPRETRLYVHKVLDTLEAYRAMEEEARLK